MRKTMNMKDIINKMMDDGFSETYIQSTMWARYSWKYNLQEISKIIEESACNKSRQ